MRISGATGGTAAFVNGIYDPTSPPEIHDGHHTYRKRDDQDRWLEYSRSANTWQCVDTEDKGSDLCRAHIKSELPIDQCVSGTWLAALCAHAAAPSLNYRHSERCC